MRYKRNAKYDISIHACASAAARERGGGEEKRAGKYQTKSRAGRYVITYRETI